MTNMTEQEAREMEENLTEDKVFIRREGTVTITDENGKVEISAIYRASDLLRLLDKGINVRAALSILEKIKD
jgi:rRNA processing protein Krr1/Pno1